MRRGVFARVLVPPASLGIAVWAGWSLGYRSLTAYVVFGILCALVAAAARRIVRSVFPPAASPVGNVDNVENDEILRIGVVSFALIVLAGFVLGGAGFINVGAYLAFFAVCFVVCLVRLKPDATYAPDTPYRPDTETYRASGFSRTDSTYQQAIVAGILVAAVAFILAVGLIQSPLTLYDSLSYHLLFPARWLQDHRLSIVPTPFSDPAQAYQPSNGELFFLWLMLPFHGDLLARIGQVPFLLLNGAALFALARRLGASRNHAIYAPLFFFLARPVVEQAVGADVDLISTAMFAASMYFGLIAVDTDRASDWALWGVSGGLFFGTKYLALVYAPVFLLFPVVTVVRGIRLKSAWAIPGVAVLGFPWYLRNWLIAGSPIYPASLGVAGLTVARGAFSRAAMAGTVFHATGLRLWSVVAAHSFGAPLALFWLPCAFAAVTSILVRRRWWPAGFIVFLLPLMTVLVWFGLPANIDSRFLLPAMATSLVLFACPFGDGARWKMWNAALHVLYLGGAAWLLVGSNAEIHVPSPWYMGGWLSLNGIIDSRHFAWFAAFAVMGTAAWRAAPAWRLRAAGALAVVAASVLVMGVDVRCAPARCQPLRITSAFIQPSLLDAWDWVAHNTRNASFANTGNNVAYPLFGDQLTNHVSYVNIDRHTDWHLHDYARARIKPGASLAGTPLALASGELVPAPGGPASDGNAERPRYERMNGYRDGWTNNLKSLGIDHLFVSTLSAYEVDYVWHNDGGFPIEDEWARADPVAFTLVYENSHVRIYAISQGSLTPGPPPASGSN
jgi:hypothetical protein